MESALNTTLLKRGSGSRAVQAAPLTEEVVAPVKAPPTSVPAVDGTSNVEPLGVGLVGLEHGVRYGGHTVTRFNS
jgi:hypothetical protein